ncbi:TraX family protein [Desulfobulbus alkaliphilus]|uniref:TraX family protein n=1 Tax=Desulfobulbus alkaliphilus TaxID=869814 RepID=UPI001964F7F6|nr:TraX family protein [Desulfobulbus alkaliphilus]MBM9535803.1 hypothetical protein [Desulfobulbus alkaliphilus]
MRYPDDQGTSTTAVQLKFLACLCMLMDHVGHYLLADQYAIMWPLRLVGRLAFPLFAFFIVVGYRHTRDVSRYWMRLFLLGVVSWFVIAWLEGSPPSQLNILFTLCLGLMAIAGYERSPSWWIPLLCLLAAELGRVEYGSMGVLLIFVMHRFHGQRNPFLLSSGLILLVLLGVNLLIDILLTDPHTDWTLSWLLHTHPTAVFQPFSVLSLLLICRYNGQIGWHANWLQYSFYLFYPLHLAAIKLLL